MDGIEQEWLRLSRVATLLGVSKRTVWRHLSRLSPGEWRRTGAGYWEVRGDVIEKLR